MADGDEKTIPEKPKKRGGFRPGSGRKKGSPNRVTAGVRMTAAQMRAEIERDGPGFIMMATEAIRWFRGKAAQASQAGNDSLARQYLLDMMGSIARVANYVHPRLASVAVRTSPLDLSRLSTDELRFLARLYSEHSTDQPAIYSGGASKAGTLN